MKENVVSKRRMPACAKLEKVISCEKYGEIAAIFTWNGNQITFFRADFLEIKSVAWYFAEKFTEDCYHEELPYEVLESIRKNDGFFLSKNFLSFSKDGNVVSTEDGEPITHSNYDEAKLFAACLNVPELKSDLMYGVIYDVLGKWLIETGTLTKEEWINSPTTEEEQKQILERDCGGWNLEELLGNIFNMEWTQEYFSKDYVVAREGIPGTDGEGNYPSRMRYSYRKNMRNSKAKIRAFMYFE